jgi:hypothetical protein
MGNKPLTMTKENRIIGYDTVNSKNYILITTLCDGECFIKDTLTPNEEVTFINECISTNSQKNIIIYGKNYLDKTIYDQYNKLNSLGFDKIYLYPGGIFEWLLLQETFGCDMFETNYTEKDILKYRPK